MSEAQRDSEILALGFPLTQNVVEAPGLITGTDHDGRWLTNAGLVHGMSGAPAFDRSGAVVGIVAGGYEEKNSLNLLIPISFSTGLLQFINSPLRPPDLRATPSLLEAAQASQSPNEQASSSFDKVSRDRPWQNSLGMIFVPVAGTQVLFSVWDTRVKDFETFAQRTGYNAMGGMLSLDRNGWQNFGDTWKDPGFSQGPTDPVVGVSWADAEEFCKWLTSEEQRSGILPAGRVYRLPTDEEWSAGVGLKYEVGKSPSEKSGKIMRFPWDFPKRREASWPPPAGAGNYAGDGDNVEPWRSVIRGYKDGYPRTSPVGSFSANQFGLYDMGGNVWQWCEDWYYTNQSRVLRGASWFDVNENYLLASFRSQDVPDRCQGNIGFRCVVAPESSR